MTTTTTTTPFGPQLIGETEKALNAILRRALRGPELSEPEWVTLRLADQLASDRETLLHALAERARFDEPGELVDRLTRRGLLDGARLSASGQALVESVQARIAETTGPIWRDLPAQDVAAAQRVLTEIVGRARRVLGVGSDSYTRS